MMVGSALLSLMSKKVAVGLGTAEIVWQCRDILQLGTAWRARRTKTSHNLTTPESVTNLKGGLCWGSSK